MDTLEYLNKLSKKIKEKDLQVFWLMVDREDFKPIKNHSDKQLKELFKKKIKYYAGKRIATIKFFVDNKESSINKNESLVHLVFGIRKISDRGLLNETGLSLKVRYYQDDLNVKKPTLKDAQRFMKLCADETLRSSVIGGHKYSDLIKKLDTLNIKF
jgi:hypothetical protein